MYMSGYSSLTDSKLQNSTLVQAACSRRQKDCMDECVLDNWCTTAEQLNKPQFSGKWNLLAFWQYITSHHTHLLVCSPLIVAGAGSCHANYKIQWAVPDPLIHICARIHSGCYTGETRTLKQCSQLSNMNMVTGYMSTIFLSTNARRVSGRRTTACASDSELPRICFATLTNCRVKKSTSWLHCIAAVYTTSRKAQVFLK